MTAGAAAAVGDCFAAVAASALACAAAVVVVHALVFVDVVEFAAAVAGEYGLSFAPILFVVVAVVVAAVVLVAVEQVLLGVRTSGQVFLSSAWHSAACATPAGRCPDRCW